MRLSKHTGGRMKLTITLLLLLLAFSPISVHKPLIGDK
jgi:hypothetical protein